MPHEAASASAEDSALDTNIGSASDGAAPGDGQPRTQALQELAEPDEGAATGTAEQVRAPRGGDTGPAADVAHAIGVLAEIALQMDDPVAALEEGAESLAEFLAEQDTRVREQQAAGHAQRQMGEARAAEFRQAYQHARLHRVGELIDVGYSLDQAVSITNANEAEIRQRALAAGRDPSDIIYEYAHRHGFRPALAMASRSSGDGRSAMKHSTANQPPSALERLAQLSDQDFAEATRGDRWARLLKNG